MSDTASKIAEQEGRYPVGFGLYQKILNHRKSNDVLRYHTIPPIKSETVGHHSAGVAILCIAISELKPSIQLLMAALLHDMHESKTGDIPAMAKWDSPELASALHQLEKRYDSHFMPFPNLLTDYEQRVLKQADMLDHCFKAKEEMRMGNQQYSQVFNRGMKYLRDHNPLPITITFLEELSHGC